MTAFRLTSRSQETGDLLLLADSGHFNNANCQSLFKLF